jgi:hypothetical protein
MFQNNDNHISFSRCLKTKEIVCLNLIPNLNFDFAHDNLPLRHCNQKI